MVTRMEGAKTPWGRIAVAVEDHERGVREAYRKTRAGPENADYADLGEMLEPYVKRECILFCIQRVRKRAGEDLTKLIEELALELAAEEKKIPPEHRL